MKRSQEEIGKAYRKIPSHMGFALDQLINAYGWTAKELAEKAGVTPSAISLCISGDTLTRERLEELAGLMGLGPAEVERALLAARLLLPPPPAPWSPVDPTPDERRIHEKAAAVAGGEVMDIVLETLLREDREEKRRRALEEGRKLAKELLTFSRADRRVLVEAAPDYQHWGLAVVLCAESEAVSPQSRDKALELAELALFVARHVPGTEAFRSRLQGWCTGHIANIQRGRDLPSAERTFARAWELWRAGEDPAGLLSEAYLLDMEASLRRDQRLFAQALKLHQDALELARPEELGVILSNQAATLKDSGDPESALQSMKQAAKFIDGERQPRLRFGLRFNEASSLLLLGRAEEAVPIVSEVRDLAERLRNEMDLLKTLWLEGNTAAGLGQKEEALSKLEQVRHELEVRNLPYDYALVSLDVALLHREEGRFEQITALVSEILDIFRVQGVHREALGAVILLKEAAENKRITTALVRRLQDYLTKVRNNPQLRFEI